MDTEQLWAVEEQGWEALATGAEAATRFYDRVLGDDVRFLFPGGMVIDDRGAVLESMGGEPWSSYELSDRRVLPLGDGAAVVSYRVVARRGDVDYAALVTSTYVRRGDEWRLVVHQQTPA